MKARLAGIALALCAAALIACGGGGTKKPTPTALPPTATATSTSAPATDTPVSQTPAAGLAPADSDTPAAGACTEPPAGDIMALQINGDIPFPRCARVRPDQSVSFINATQETIEVKLASYDLTIEPGDTEEIDAPAGTYLAPGVHVAHTSTYGGESGPEIWVQP